MCFDLFDIVDAFVCFLFMKLTLSVSHLLTQTYDGFNDDHWICPPHRM